MSGDNNLIPIYEKGLKHGLLACVLSNAKPPTTIEEWYHKASKQDAVYQCLKALHSPGQVPIKQENRFRNLGSQQ